MPASAHSSVSARHSGVAGQHARRVVRRVDHDQARLGPHRRPDPVDVEGPAVLLAELVQGGLGSGRQGDLGQALVARPGHDRVIAGPDDDVQEAEDRLLCAGEDEHLVRADRVVERGDLRPQEGMPARLGVTQAQALPQAAGLVVGQRQELGHRVTLEVRRTQEVPNGELPAGEVALELEVGDLHLPGSTRLS